MVDNDARRELVNLARTLFSCHGLHGGVYVKKVIFYREDTKSAKKIDTQTKEF